MTDNNIPLQNKDKINNNDDFESPPLASLNINGYICCECSNKCSKCSEEINRLRNEINRKNFEISVIKNKLDSHFDDMMGALLDYTEKNKKMVKEKDTKIQLEKEKQDLIDRIKQLEQYHTEQSKQIAKLQYDNDNLVNNVIELQKDNKELTTKYETINNVYIVLKREHSELKREHSELKREHSELNTKFDGLKTEFEDLRDSITSLIVSQQNAELSVYVYISDLSKIYLRYILMVKLRETDAVKYHDSKWDSFSCNYSEDELADKVSWDTYKIDLARLYDFNDLRNDTVHPTKPTKAAINDTINKIKAREEELKQMELWDTNTTTNDQRKELTDAYIFLKDSIVNACTNYQPPKPKNKTYKNF